MRFLGSILPLCFVVVSCHQQWAEPKTQEEASANKEYYKSWLKSDNSFDELLVENKKSVVNDTFFKETSKLTCSKKTNIIYSTFLFSFCLDAVDSLLKMDFPEKVEVSKLDTTVFLCKNLEFEIIDFKQKSVVKSIRYQNYQDEVPGRKSLSLNYKNENLLSIGLIWDAWIK